MKTIKTALGYGSVMALLICNDVYALDAMTENEMSNATGEGLGFALEDFVVDSDGATLSVTGINSSDGSPIDIDWTDLYIMGEGSNSGQNKVGANIGSYNHPWVFRSLRGSRGLIESDPAYDAEYAGVGNDIALLELATDRYDSPLQASSSYGQFSYYQGCVWGQPGCDSLGDVGANGVAVQNVQALYDQLNIEQQQITSVYSGSTLSSLEGVRDDVYDEVIIFEEQDVEAEQLDVEQALDFARVQYEAMTDAEREQTPFRSVPPCAESNLDFDYCNGRENDYLDALDALADQQAELRTQSQELVAAEEDSSLTGLGVSYRKLVTDINRYKALCGYEDSLTSCENGLVAETGKTLSDVSDVSIALGSGVNRRPGMDIGATFEFTVNSVDENGTVAPRADFLDIDLKGLFLDGTSFRLWSRPDQNGLSELNAELRLNLFVKEIDIRACPDTDCTTAAAIEANTLNLDNFFVDLNLGYGEVQPLKFAATSDGNFVATLEAPDHQNVYANPTGKTAKAFYEDYYANAPKSFLYIGDVRVGSGPNASIGSTTIEGFRAQYLRVQSRDL